MELPAQRILSSVENVVCNDLILSIIIDNLDVPGLKKFRSVCRHWYEKSFKAWTTQTIIRIGPQFTSNQLESTKWHIDLETFVDFMEHNCIFITGVSPFQNYSLEEWSSNKIRSFDIHSKFFRICGDHIRHLRLVNCFTREHGCELTEIVNKLGANVKSVEIIHDESLYKFSNSAFYNAHIPNLFKNGPVHTNVTDLELHTYNPCLSYQFLRKFPNLKRLKIKSILTKGLSDILPSICTLRCSTKKRILNLEHLEILDTCSQGACGFIQADMPLKYLSWNIENTGKSMIQACLEHYAKSLETLKLFRPPISMCETFPDFPFKATFQNLRVLELWGNVTTNFNFLLFTPSLKKLRVDLECFEKNNLFVKWGRVEGTLSITKNDLVEASDKLSWRDSFEMSGLEELVIDFEICLESWAILKKWMPNLKVLEGPMNNQAFELVCTQWKTLLKLRLRFGSEISDEGVVGKRPESKSTIQQLKYLKSFVLEMECGKGRLTDLSADLGFLQLEYLQNLVIYGSLNAITPVMEMKLERKIGRVQLLRHCQKLSSNHDELMCCKWTNYQQLLNSL